MTRIGMNMAVAAAAVAGSSGAVLAQTAGAAPAPGDRDEVRAIVADLLSDAQTRSSLLQSGASAGHDGKFFVASPDGNFRLNVGGDLQFRYLLNFRDQSNTVSGGNGGDDFDPGFQTTRTRLHFDGNIISKDWTYKVLTRTDSSNTILVEEAWVRYDLGNGWSALWGQFKLPLLHEELVSSVRQLAAERSLVNAAFTQSRSQGVQLAYAETDWRAAGAFSDGLASENTDFTNQGLHLNTVGPFMVKGEADYAFTGRIEFRFAGDWKQYDDFMSRPGDAFSAVVGGAVHYQASPDTSIATDVDRDTFEYTLEASLKGDRWSVYGAFIGRDDTFRGPGTANDATLNDFGLVVQGAYSITESTELFARWEGLFTDNDRNLTRDNFHFVTFGVNEYFSGQAAKFTADLVWSLNKTADLNAIGILPNTSVGLLGDSKENEVVIRLQMQLLF